jgi:hypothetical protein
MISVSWNHSHTWSRYHSALLSQTVSQTSRHRQSWLSNLLTPYPHRTYLFPCSCWLELVQNSIASYDALFFFWQVWFVVYWKLLYLESLLVLFSLQWRLPHVLCLFNIFPEDEDRGISSICHYKIIFLNEQNRASATTKFYDIQILVFIMAISFLHSFVSLFKDFLHQ